jgi:Fe-S cluster biogenesis protein NfuA
MSLMTLKAGIEEAIKKAAPEVHSVEAVNMPSLV